MSRTEGKPKRTDNETLWRKNSARLETPESTQTGCTKQETNKSQGSKSPCRTTNSASIITVCASIYEPDGKDGGKFDALFWCKSDAATFCDSLTGLAKSDGDCRAIYGDYGCFHKMNAAIATPGQQIGDAKTADAGAGTYVLNGVIFAAATGLVQMSKPPNAKVDHSISLSQRCVSEGTARDPGHSSSDSSQGSFPSSRGW